MFLAVKLMRDGNLVMVNQCHSVSAALCEM